MDEYQFDVADGSVGHRVGRGHARQAVVSRIAFARGTGQRSAVAVLPAVAGSALCDVAQPFLVGVSSCWAAFVVVAWKNERKTTCERQKLEQKLHDKRD